MIDPRITAKGRLSLLLLICLIPFYAKSQPQHISGLNPRKALTQYIYSVWKIENGLPQNDVTAIVQSKDGYLWLGTQEGLARFDGVEFAVYSSRNTPVLRNQVIRALCEDRHGILWIGTYGGGLYSYNNGVFQQYSVADGLVNDNVVTIFNDSQGTLWIGTDGGLSAWKDGAFTNYSTRNGLLNDNVRSVCEDGEGNIWIGTAGGLVRFVHGTFTGFTTKNGLSHNDVQSVCYDGRGNLWIGTYGGGVDRWTNGAFARNSGITGLSGKNVRTLCVDRNHTLWIGTSSGLNRLADGVCTFITEEDGLSTNFFNTLYEDREGSLWLGMGAGGLGRIRDGACTAYTTKEGLSINYVRSITKGNDGSLWIGTINGGLNRFKNGVFKKYTERDGLASDRIWSLNEARDGSLWIGTDGKGVSRLHNGVFTTLTTANGLSNAYVKAICEDRTGTIWFGTDGGGLNKYVKGRFIVYTMKEGLVNDHVKFICEDHEGDLWIGTDGGLSRLSGGTFISYTTKNGLPSNLVLSVFEDAQGVVWIGTRAGGLLRMKDGKIVAFTTNEGLFDNTVYQILEDSKENLWMSCNRGIFRASKKELNEIAEGRRTQAACVSYGLADGMKDIECNGGSQPAGCKTRSGALWFPTQKGVVTIDPEKMEINNEPPPVVLEQVLADNKRIVEMAKAEFSPGIRNFEFHYTALSLFVPERVNFKYKLEGFDKDWVDAGTRRVAFYTNLQPGEYRFRVIACNNSGIWNTAGATFDFDLHPGFYQTWWFYILCLMLSGGIAWAVQQMRVRVLLTREKELSGRVNDALAHIKMLNGLIPICSKCKKIRDDKGYWNHLEQYINEHSEAKFSHSVCPDCAKELYGELFSRAEQKRADSSSPPPPPDSTKE